MKKILGIILEDKERFYEHFAETDYVTICRNCGTIFSFENEDIIQKSMVANTICITCQQKVQLHKKYLNMKSGCICAKPTDQYHGWECEVTDGACVFITPDSRRCAEEYGEGPDVEYEKSLYGNIQDLFKTSIAYGYMISKLENISINAGIEKIEQISQNDDILKEHLENLLEVAESYDAIYEDDYPSEEIDLDHLDDMYNLSVDLGYTYEPQDECDCYNVFLPQEFEYFKLSREFYKNHELDRDEGDEEE